MAEIILSLVKSKELSTLQENGKLEQYKLTPEGIKQAKLAGESFLKVRIQFEISFFFPDSRHFMVQTFHLSYVWN